MLYRFTLVSHLAFGLSLIPMAALAQETAPLGALADVVSQQLIAGWQGSAEDGWYVLNNPASESSEQVLMLHLGPPSDEGRRVSVNVAIDSKQPNAAIGILSRASQSENLCLMEITASRQANLICVIDKAFQQIASVENAARLDGSDILEMVEIPGAARYYVNGQLIGDASSASALAADVGLMAFGIGRFGIADFALSNAATGAALAATSGSGGLPPKGGKAPAAEATGTAPNTAPGNAPGTETSTDPGIAALAAVMGPLAEVIAQSQLRDGWQARLQDQWLILDNPATKSAEQVFLMSPGPIPKDGRIFSLDVGLLPPTDQKASDFPYSALGLLLDNPETKASCAGEITGAGLAIVLCFDAEGKSSQLGQLEGVARMDGSDRLTYVEFPEGGAFVLNEQLIARLDGHPALGGQIGTIAYERGSFYLAGFRVTDLAPAAPETGASGSAAPDPADHGPAELTAEGDGPLPLFNSDGTRLIGVYLGLTNSIFMHEFGHALIGELQLPSTGPEEDAVDIFSALHVVDPTMYPSGDEKVDAIGREVATYAALQWFYSGTIAAQQGDAPTPWQDEHTADLKRFRNIFCVIYGGNPDLFLPLAQQAGLEERTLARCEGEFSKQNRAWRTILAPHTRIGPWHPEGLLPADAPGAPITVVFEPSQSRVGNMLADKFGEALRGGAEDLAQTYALPRPLTVTYRDCDALNAWYDPSSGSVTMCYDLLEYLAVTISDVEMGTVGGVAPEAAAEPAPKTAADPSASPVGKSGKSSKNPFSKAGKASAAPPPSALDERADLGVPPTLVLFPAPYRGPTPMEHARAEVIQTPELQACPSSNDLEHPS